MARSSDPNSANSQFFICFEAAPHLIDNILYLAKLLRVWKMLIKLPKVMDQTVQFLIQIKLLVLDLNKKIINVIKKIFF